MSDDGKLGGGVALVTGGGGAIGGAIARLYAAEGAKVLVADVRTDMAEQVAAEINAAGGKAVAQTTDVSAPASAEASVAAALAAFGSLNILVNVAAAVTPDGNVVDLPLEDWNEAFAVNLTGPFYLCKAVAAGMIERKFGKIINISST